MPIIKNTEKTERKKQSKMGEQQGGNQRAT